MEKDIISLFRDRMTNNTEKSTGSTGNLSECIRVFNKVAKDQDRKIKHISYTSLVKRNFKNLIYGRAKICCA